MSPGIVLGGLLLAIGVALGTLYLLRRREGGWWSDPGRSAGVLGAARGPFAVILAFVILVGFQRFDDAQTSASAEAAATRSMFKDADFFDPHARQAIQSNVLCYARAVVALDWPAMRDGSSSTRVDDLAGLLSDNVRGVRAPGRLQQNAASELLTESNDREQARSDRLATAQGGLPQPVWIVLIVGAIGVLAWVLLFADPKEGFTVQAVMVGSVTAIVVGGLLLVWFLSHPFQGEAGSIEPVAMKRAVLEMEHDPAYAEAGLPITCDFEGRPL